MKKTFTLALLLCLFSQAFPQANKPVTPSLKGNGGVFFLETFNWADPTDVRGWKAPAGYDFEDPTDIGYNWHWWPNDSLYAQNYTKEPPMQSTTAADGSLCLFLSRYNLDKDPRIDVDNSIIFPPFDCSQHGTVVVSYETCFMCYDANSTWEMLMEVSVDNWVHSASYDVSFGCNHKERPDKTTPGIPAIFQANISDVAAGQPNVQIKMTWRGTTLYFWQIDDFKLSEAWDNDLQMKFAQMEWTDGDDNTARTPSFMMPKSQLAGNGFTNFKAAALNFGEYDQEDSYFSVDITKNGQNVFSKAGDKKNIYTLITDTTTITDTYTPTDYGHYKVDYKYQSKEVDDTPLNNAKSVYFDVTDSVFSYADNSAEESVCWGLEAYGTDGTANLNHKMGAKFPIYQDCEVSSISAFIAGGIGDGSIDFRYVLYSVPIGSDDETPYERLVTEYVTYDSTMIGKWLTLSLSCDGEAEFLKAGDLVYAAVDYNNTHIEKEIKRYDNLKLGADHSFKILDPVSVAMGEAQTWDTGNSLMNSKLLMIRLNINEHGNRNDGVDVAHSAALMSQNYPNPFNQKTDITYELVNDSEVDMIVTDLTGRVVLEQHQGRQPSGKHTLHIDAGNLDSGIYMYTLRAGTFTETKRMTVSK